jgi:hypothetical protein
MSFDAQSLPKVLHLYLEISQYPILAKRIRQEMREELFSRGIVTPHAFEQEVREKAILSQQREGMHDPFAEETPEIWQQRMDKIRDQVTDFYFAYNLPHDLLQEIVSKLISERAPDQPILLSFNPELAPWDLLFAKGEEYETYPPEERRGIEHHLREIQVVLIKAMISDQLAFVRVAREYFTIKDLKEIRAHRIGRGKIGGKAAGMILAHKVLRREGAKYGIDVDRCICVPESWFIGSDVFYDFHEANDLFRNMNQKYKKHEQMIADYPAIYEAYLSSQLPSDVRYRLMETLEEVGNHPLIVRSSSLLEDSFDTSFAGKYDSFFLPNQGDFEENLRALQQAIVRIYASVVRPDALIYRDRMGLTDYDERMAILIQRVEGEQHGRYFFPDLAGVGFSHNPFRWNPRIRAEDGFLRMVVGLGTRAVDRVGSDYPRMVALSHPTLRPEKNISMVRHYSQQSIDVIDLVDNEFKTLAVNEVIGADFDALGAIMSVDQGDHVQPMTNRPLKLDPSRLVVTFDRLLHEREFVDLMRESLAILERAYERPVDTEFAAKVLRSYPRPEARLTILQCRPLSRRRDDVPFDFPTDIPEKDILFTANQQVPQGVVEKIEYTVWVDPRTYAQIADPNLRLEIGQVVGRLNTLLPERGFVLMGPGRWGSSNIHLGVRVTYSDIYNTAVLIEVAHEEQGHVPEVSYGTHFFQDLVEANIYPLPLYPDDPTTIYCEEFFQDAPNHLSELLPDVAALAPYIKVIHIPEISADRRLTIVMDSENERAVGYLQ